MYSFIHSHPMYFFMTIGDGAADADSETEHLHGLCCDVDIPPQGNVHIDALKLQGIEKIKAAAESHKLFIALGFYRSF